MKLRIIALVLTGLAVGAAVALAVLPGGLERLLPRPGAMSVGTAQVGGPFQLVDHTGKRVTDRDFRGKYLLVFFGFTFCPDICPTALQVMAAALEGLGAKAERITPVFITVDPERDTPEQLASYVSSFHPRLVGLTGSAEEIAAAAKAYRVYYKKSKDEKSSAEYTMDHTSIVYLMGPDGAFVTHFTHATSAETMKARLAQVL